MTFFGKFILINKIQEAIFLMDKIPLGVFLLNEFCTYEFPTVLTVHPRLCGNRESLTSSRLGGFRVVRLNEFVKFLVNNFSQSRHFFHVCLTDGVARIVSYHLILYLGRDSNRRK